MSVLIQKRQNKFDKWTIKRAPNKKSQIINLEKDINVNNKQNSESIQSEIMTTRRYKTEDIQKNVEHGQDPCRRGKESMATYIQG